MSLKEAVLTLRRSLGESQQAFATRIGISIRALSTYENGRRPNYRSLKAMEQVARKAGDVELAEVFSDAMNTLLDGGIPTRLVEDALADIAYSRGSIAIALNGALDQEQRDRLTKAQERLQKAYDRLNAAHPFEDKAE